MSKKISRAELVEEAERFGINTKNKNMAKICQEIRKNKYDTNICNDIESSTRKQIKTSVKKTSPKKVTSPPKKKSPPKKTSLSKKTSPSKTTKSPTKKQKETIKTNKTLEDFVILKYEDLDITVTIPKTFKNYKELKKHLLPINNLGFYDYKFQDGALVKDNFERLNQNQENYIFATLKPMSNYLELKNKNNLLSNDLKFLSEHLNLKLLELKLIKYVQGSTSVEELNSKIDDNGKSFCLTVTYRRETNPYAIKRGSVSTYDAIIKNDCNFDTLPKDWVSYQHLIPNKNMNKLIFKNEYENNFFKLGSVIELKDDVKKITNKNLSSPKVY